MPSITPEVAGSRGMFKKVQHALKGATGRHVHLTADVHNNLEAWHELVCSLSSRPTYLREQQPFPPTWMGKINALGYTMVGVCQELEAQYFF